MADEWALLKDLRMDGTPHECMQWKVSIIAVKHGDKPLFFYSESKTPRNMLEVSETIRQLGGLKCTPITRTRGLTKISPAEVARYMSSEGAGLWVYRGDEESEGKFREGIEGLLAGRVREGDLLGYPKCCVDWYEKEGEAPLGRLYMSALGSERNLEVAKALLHSAEIRRYVGSLLGAYAISNSYLRQEMARSISRYPFIPHVACPSCLEAKGRCPSSMINTDLADLAMRISQRMYERVTRCAEKESEKYRN